MKTIDFPKLEVVQGSGGQDATCNGNHWTWERTLERTTLWYDGGNSCFMFDRFVHNHELCEFIQAFETGRTLGIGEGVKSEKFRLRQFLSL